MKAFAKVNKKTKLVERVVLADQMTVWDYPDFEDWVETSQDGLFRKNYAGVGYKYDSERDAFIPPQPYESWKLNEETCRWEAPVPMTDPMKPYWDETTLSWRAINEI